MTLRVPKSYIVVSLSMVGLSVGLATEVSFAWRANSEPDLAGYRLYWGPDSRQYTNAIQLGLVTDACLEISGQQYFALTAVNSNSLESEFTAELVYEPLWLITERSLDGVLWEPVITNEVAPLRALEFFRLQMIVPQTPSNDL